jgi:hypothetical protein
VTPFYFWFVDELQGGTASTGMSLRFGNGQTASIAAMGKFDMHKPELDDMNMCEDLMNTILFIPNPCVYVTNSNGLTISLGNSWGGYARFWVSFRSQPGHRYFYTQIVQTYRQWGNNPPEDSGSDWWLDTPEGNKTGGIYTAETNGIGRVQQTDWPGVTLEAPEAHANEIFKTYIQYRPSDDSIGITLGRVDWSWGFDAQYSNGQWNITPISPSSPAWHGDSSFPQWEGIRPGPQ